MLRRLSPPALRLLLLGAGLAAALHPAGASAGASPSLYQQMLAITQSEMLNAQGDTEGNMDAPTNIKRFSAAVTTLPAGPVDPAEIPDVLAGGMAFCQQSSTRTEMSELQECGTARTAIQQTVKREEQLQALGNDLQIIASSYERPVLRLPGDELDFAARARALARIWKAGTDAPAAAGGGLTFRERSVTADETLKMIANDISTKLSALAQATPAGMDSEQFVAAVWRYDLGGVRFVRGERTDYPPPNAPATDPDGTEAQYRWKRWPELEKSLLSLRSYLDTLSVDPPLQNGQVIIYRLPADVQELLPPNVLAWAYTEKDEKGGLTGDVGLTWDAAVEPVQPSLCKDGQAGCVPIPGGAYPAAPQDGRTLCTSPLARLGYLCRAFNTEPGNLCKNPQTPSPNSIVLAACTADKPATETPGGPRFCQDVAWHQPVPFDANTQCKVQITCGEDTESFAGLTKPKEADGAISVTIKNTPLTPAPYMFIHELTHARQECGLPPGTHLQENPDPGDSEEQKSKKLDACCRTEGEANRNQCDAMQADGIFDGSPVSAATGLPINKETCTQVLTDFECKSIHHKACPAAFSASLSEDTEKKFQDDVVQLSMARKPPTLPLTCKQAAGEAPLAPGMAPDPRVQGTITDIEKPDNVCQIGLQTTYDNTIGNNLCYLNSCLGLMSDHNIVPGRAPRTVGDESYPYASCMRPDPAFGTVLELPAAESWAPPPYRPAELLKQMDQALCVGLAPQNPPALCAFSINDGLNQTRNRYDGIGSNILDQTAERADAMQGLQDMSEALGFRMGTRLYVDYLQKKGETLQQIIQGAATLLGNFPKVRFPTVMCPLSDAGGTAFVNNPQYCSNGLSSTAPTAP
jgi:hypothetical protein